MDSSADGGGGAGSGSRANSGMVGARGNFRAGAANALSGNEEVFAGGRSGAAAVARCDSGCVGGAGRGAGGLGDEPPRPVERDGACGGTRGGGSFRAIRGCGSAQRVGRRRCEVSHGRDRRVCDGGRKKSRDSSGVESEPSGSGGSGGNRARARKADARAATREWATWCRC